ncbi:MAG: undecaprenyl-phosphate glucose phosphotransferase [Flavobacteriales bacterium]|nr:undecaprenyl-phosphate glucose phosphotransferase [Flavobacteriales bacterium]
MFKKEWELTSFFLVYDLVLITISFIGIMQLKFGMLDVNRYYLVLPVILISWLIVVVFAANQNFVFRDSLVDRFKGQLFDFFLFAGVVSFTLLLLELQLYSRFIVFGTILTFFVLRSLGYLVLYRYLVYMRAKGRHVSKVLILGAGRVGQNTFEFFKRNRSLGYQVQGFLDDNPDASLVDKNLVLGSLDDLDSVLDKMVVNEIIVALPLSVGDKIRVALESADYHGIRVRLIPDYYRMFERTFQTSKLGNFPVVNLRQIPLDMMYNASLKRSFDLLFSVVALVLLAPVFIVIAISIKLNSSGPVLYRPVRVGQGGREFKCLKFRTMRNNEDSRNNTKSTVQNDPRITSVGAFLRKYSLDELPQFINVLKNDMSVVGPRPHRTFLNESMQQQVEGYMLRHYIKPGISGWAQVNGWRGPTETFEQKHERTMHDLWYIENWTLWLDIRIVLLTVLGRKVKDNAF